jgi:hypothetical protein
MSDIVYEHVSDTKAVFIKDGRITLIVKGTEIHKPLEGGVSHIDFTMNEAEVLWDTLANNAPLGTK